ncbi:unnamed protein product [Nippostrongylus brasiliensis]|uniref:Transposase n=1 Tax=Nippostrongylus brasiliensis TaxID=27835 RepID=A0A0N4Y7C1_NIPBR|nr:unnamed protein product [Nippostrongylus brasiliensis]
MDEQLPLTWLVDRVELGISQKSPQRTRAPVGVRQVHRVVQSSSSLTHSYTVVPVLYADGRLVEKLFVVLAEPDRLFPLSGCWCVMSGSRPTKTTFAIVDSGLDSKTTRTFFRRAAGQALEVMTVPPGITALHQPLDVFFLRHFEGFIRRIHGSVLHRSRSSIVSREIISWRWEYLPLSIFSAVLELVVSFRRW